MLVKVPDNFKNKIKTRWNFFLDEFRIRLKYVKKIQYLKVFFGSTRDLFKQNFGIIPTDIKHNNNNFNISKNKLLNV